MKVSKRGGKRCKDVVKLICFLVDRSSSVFFIYLIVYLLFWLIHFIFHFVYLSISFCFIFFILFFYPGLLRAMNPLVRNTKSKNFPILSEKCNQRSCNHHQV